MAESPESPLERMQSKLYAPKAVDGVSVPTPLPPTSVNAAQPWAPEPEKPKGKLSGSVIFLIAAVGFFVIAGIATATVLFLGGRSVSSDNLSIVTEGPTTISGGEAVPLLITVKNENPLVAMNATLEIDFPEGTFEADDSSVPLSHIVEELGDIPAGESVRKTIRASFFGEENDRILIPITVEYATGNSNATFVAKETHTFVISTAPVTIAVETLPQIAAGQPLTLVVTARSNAATPLERVALAADYPFGFSATSEEPEPSGTLFMLGTLSPGEEKEIRIAGPINGQDGEERVFRFSIGSLKSEDSKEFAVSYSSKETTVMLTKPFLAVTLLVNRGQEETIIVGENQLIPALVSWKNALKTSILDGKISIALKGDAVDLKSIDTTNAFFRSTDRTIIFDGDTASGLKNLSPNDAGNGSFTFKTKTGEAMNVLRNPVITMDVSVSGRRMDEGGITETVTSAIRRTIKVASTLTLEAYSLYTTGPFDNTGPWPPEVEKETTYTIMLKTTNTVNSVANATVSATLPSYVSFTGEMSPKDSMKFNETTREVTWTITDFPAGTTKEAAFQVKLLPSLSQRGTSPVLIDDVHIAGFDRFVQQELEDEANEVSTQNRQDPAFKIGGGDVR